MSESAELDQDRPKKLIKVNVDREVPEDKIRIWLKHIVDKVYAEMPPLEYGDIEIVVMMDFSKSVNMTKELKKMIMETLEDELLR
ncbi:unnamed protein product [Caenorhabditis angaria]|uniref:Uncharacterized protein n=1 Tax=Caenorhabditis angaria TaxID=860376 RepID=A0A9P1IJU4_9PELO|nr:unnamed protein product [Caenorhabditis angaria]